jgi:hypothetical protein
LWWYTNITFIHCLRHTEQHLRNYRLSSSRCHRTITRGGRMYERQVTHIGMAFIKMFVKINELIGQLRRAITHTRTHESARGVHATDLHQTWQAYSLRPGREHKRVKTPERSWVLLPVRAVPVARKLNTIEERRQDQSCSSRRGHHRNGRHSPEKL